MGRVLAEQWKKASIYLDEVLCLAEQERAEWLLSFRRTQPELATVLESLVSEHYTLAQERFLEQSPQLPLGRQVLAGERIGAYSLLAPIGYGGMGTVWRAERCDGRFQRKVAVKFPHIALGGGSGEERFKREGSILGRLSHPNIAELIDAGVSASGQPYLVLEYVDGERIDRYCNKFGLNIEARISLFLDVLSAVAHAHTNLIVHRDIKPSNVLVDADGRVKLLDFGIAKLLEEQGQSAEATVLTRDGGSMLTPQYAAPEQITAAPVTTATDVYSLGVLLFVLLTGQHPAGPGPHSAADLVKAIVDTDPPPLSEFVSSGTDASAVCSAWSSDSNKLRRQFQGDLDTIVAKALKKSPQERYTSVTSFANDLERYVRNEPISARPDTTAYRAAKFVRRNRAAVTLATLALIALITGVTATMIQARTARKERDFALRERDRASRITDFMTGMFKVSDPGETVGSGVTAREILDKASNDINTGLAQDPELQAKMMHVMANVYSNLGLYNQAQSLLERAIRVSRTVGGSADPEALRSMDSLGTVLLQQGRPADAESLQRETLNLQGRVLGSEHPDTLSTLSDLAGTLSEENHLEEAEKLGREALEKQRRVLGVEDHHTIATMDNLAAILGMERRFAESEQLERETIEIERRVYGPDHLGVLNSMSNLADTLYFMGRYAEAKELWRQTLEIQRRVLGPDHPETARSTYNLGCLAARAGKRDEAFSLLGQALEHLSPRTVPRLDNDPDLNSLRADPRFDALLARTKRSVSSEAKCPL